MSDVPAEGKYIRFALASAQPNPKTCIWDVWAKEDSLFLGHIRWFGRWRRYAFYPARNTLFENVCLRDIADFLERVRAVRRG